MNVNYEYYRLFYYVCKYHSITRAANVLRMSQPNVTRALNRLEEQLGCKLLVRSTRGVTMTPEDVSLLRGRNYESGRRAFLERFGAGFPYDDMSAEVWREVEARLEHSVPLRPGLFELLDALRARNCKMAVASSTDSARVLHNLETAGVRGYFSAVIGGDQVTHSKPEPEIFLKAAAALDTPPGLCMVLEDSYNGVRAGAAAGCFTVMVPDMDPPTPEMERLAWAIVPGLTDVARLLEQTDLQKR